MRDVGLGGMASWEGFGDEAVEPIILLLKACPALVEDLEVEGEDLLEVEMDRKENAL